MARPRPEPMQVVKQRRDAALNAIVEGVPYIRFLNITFDRRGDELTGRGLRIGAAPGQELELHLDPAGTEHILDQMRHHAVMFLVLADIGRPIADRDGQCFRPRPHLQEKKRETDQCHSGHQSNKAFCDGHSALRNHSR